MFNGNVNLFENKLIASKAVNSAAAAAKKEPSMQLEKSFVSIFFRMSKHGNEPKWKEIRTIHLQMND
jgi:hypothetical protein